jgi:hypothetical protein
LRQYSTVVELAGKSPRRWPKVLQRMRQNSWIFFSWSTFRPAIIAISLILIQTIFSRLIFPRSELRFDDLFDVWWMPILIILSGLTMISVDLYFIIRVGQIDLKETERYLDEAEHWLNSWKSPLISFFTLGKINPRSMVDIEVKKAMEEGRGLLNRNLWWMSLQASLRVLFGACLWTTWAIHRSLTS